MKRSGWFTKALRNCQEFVTVEEYFFVMLCRNSGAPNENIVQNHLNIALVNVL